MKQHDIRETLTPAEEQALRQLLLETPTEGCYSAEELIDYITGILPPRRHQELRGHLEICPLCAGTAIELRTAFLPVIKLQTGWKGWRGPILSAIGFLNPMLQRAWQEQCSRHPESRLRTENIARRLRIGNATLTVGSLAACAALLLLVMRPALYFPQGPGNPPAYSPLGVDHFPKAGIESGSGIPGGNIGLPPSSYSPESVVERTLNPMDEQLPAAIRIMEHIAERNPRLLAPPIALKDLYRRVLKLEKDPVQRQTWQEKLNKLDQVRALR